MKEKKLKIKDLVTIGVFAVIYFVVTFAVGMIGVIPILFLIYPTILGIVSGTVVMLFMAKVQKPWALFIFGMLSPLIMFAGGHTYVIVLHAFAVMIIAELIRRIGHYNSFKYNMLSFIYDDGQGVCRYFDKTYYLSAYGFGLSWCYNRRTYRSKYRKNITEKAFYKGRYSLMYY